MSSLPPPHPPSQAPSSGSRLCQPSSVQARCLSGSRPFRLPRFSRRWFLIPLALFVDLESLRQPQSQASSPGSLLCRSSSIVAPCLPGSRPSRLRRLGFLVPLSISSSSSSYGSLSRKLHRLSRRLVGLPYASSSTTLSRSLHSLRSLRAFLTSSTTSST